MLQVRTELHIKRHLTINLSFMKCEWELFESVMACFIMLINPGTGGLIWLSHRKCYNADFFVYCSSNVFFQCLKLVMTTLYCLDHVQCRTKLLFVFCNFVFETEFFVSHWQTVKNNFHVCKMYNNHRKNNNNKWNSCLLDVSWGYSINLYLQKQKYSELDKNSSNNNTIQIVSNTQSEIIIRNLKLN